MQEDEMRKAWCGNCGFIGSETCCSETNWKRCRLMSSEPEGKNVEARLELARSSAREKLLDELEKRVDAETYEVEDRHNCRSIKNHIEHSDVKRIIEEFRKRDEERDS